MMKTATTTIDINTELWTMTAGFAGYTLRDSFGDTSDAELKGDATTAEELAGSLLGYCEGNLGERFFLSEEDCEEDYNERYSDGRDIANQTPESFSLLEFASDFMDSVVEDELDQLKTTLAEYTCDNETSYPIVDVDAMTIIGEVDGNYPGEYNDGNWSTADIVDGAICVGDRYSAFVVSVDPEEED